MLITNLTIPRITEDMLSEITQFIKKTVQNAKARGVVLGISGGVDSAVTAGLCVKALGKSRVLAIMMPTSFTPKSDISDATSLSNQLGTNLLNIPIETLHQSFIRSLKINDKPANLKIPAANVIARIRMIILYWYANSAKRLVVGTGDKSENLIGYFTKHGDGGADFFPIAHLYKTQVRKLARLLDIPDRIASKPSSPQLYPGHKATDEIPVDYDKLDPILYCLYDKKMPESETAKKLRINLETVKKIQASYRSSKHKRQHPEKIL